MGGRAGGGARGGGGMSDAAIARAAKSVVTGATLDPRQIPELMNGGAKRKKSKLRKRKIATEIKIIFSISKSYHKMHYVLSTLDNIYFHIGQNILNTFLNKLRHFFVSLFSDGNHAGVF